jgi:hypothetical protein
MSISFSKTVVGAAALPLQTTPGKAGGSAAPSPGGPDGPDRSNLPFDMNGKLL